ncbi:MAG: hypothetical protein ACRD01_05085 [Terriglobales bacterium]
MSPPLPFFDTSVLVAADYSDHPHHAASHPLLRTLGAGVVRHAE